MHDAGFGIFFQRLYWAYRNTVRVDAVHALFFDIGVAVFDLIFINAAAVLPHLNNVVGVRR